jgi:hypothetical protein
VFSINGREDKEMQKHLLFITQLSDFFKKKPSTFLCMCRAKEFVLANSKAIKIAILA